MALFGRAASEHVLAKEARMVRISTHELEQLENRHPGFRGHLAGIEQEVIPACPRCASADTAKVHFGVTQRAIDLASATTKMRLLPNPPGPGRYYCHGCSQYFDAAGEHP